MVGPDASRSAATRGLSRLGPDERVGTAERFIDGENGYAHLGYWIHPDHRRRGYVHDAATAVLDHAFDERYLHPVVAQIYVFDEGSVAPLEELGFERTGRSPEREYHDGEFHDDLVYANTSDGRAEPRGAVRHTD